MIGSGRRPAQLPSFPRLQRQPLPPCFDAGQRQRQRVAGEPGRLQLAADGSDRNAALACARPAGVPAPLRPVALIRQLAPARPGTVLNQSPAGRSPGELTGIFLESTDIFSLAGASLDVLQRLCSNRPLTAHPSLLSGTGPNRDLSWAALPGASGLAATQTTGAANDRSRLLDSNDARGSEQQRQVPGGRLG